MRATPVPSVKKLVEIGIDDGQARLLRRVLQTNDTDRLEEIMDKHRTTLATSRRWLHRCYNQPDVEQMQMEMANEIIDGCGVEGCGEVDMRNGPPLEYVNLGDTYQTTLCRFRDRYIVSCWGDIVERHPKLFP